MGRGKELFLKIKDSISLHCITNQTIQFSVTLLCPVQLLFDGDFLYDGNHILMYIFAMIR